MFTCLGSEKDGWALEESGPPPPPHCPPSTHTQHMPPILLLVKSRTHSHTLTQAPIHIHNHTHLYSHTHLYTLHTESKTLFSGWVELCLTHRAGEDETQWVGHSAICVHILVAVNHEPTPVKENSNSGLWPGAQAQCPLPESTTLKFCLSLRT